MSAGLENEEMVVPGDNLSRKQFFDYLQRQRPNDEELKSACDDVVGKLTHPVHWEDLLEKAAEKLNREGADSDADIEFCSTGLDPQED